MYQIYPQMYYREMPDGGGAQLYPLGSDSDDDGEKYLLFWRELYELADVDINDAQLALILNKHQQQHASTNTVFLHYTLIL